MNIITIIILVIAGIIASLLIIAFFMKREHYAEREIVIDAPQQTVFYYLKLLKTKMSLTKGQWKTPAKKKNSKEQMERLDTFIHGAEIRMPVKAKRK